MATSNIENRDYVKEFLSKNHVDFNTLIRCFNFWNEFTIDERDDYIKNYLDGKYNHIGWY